MGELKMATTALEGKIGLVTGASSGIGASTAQLLANSGVTVIVGYFSGKKRAEKVLNSLPVGDHCTLKIDIANEASVKDAAALIGDLFGHLDILVNSGGATKSIAHEDLKKLDEKLFNQIINLNAGGTFSVIRQHMSLLLASKGAVVINVSSISAFTGSGSNIAYCAAKSAVDTMNKSFARAFGPKVRFLSVSPAAVATDFVPGRNHKDLEKIAQTTPIKRIVEPEDVALAIMSCITHLRTATGTNIVIDGGRHISK